MTPETNEKIASFGDHYGNTLIELMDRCGSYSLQEVSEEEALDFLKELIERRRL